MKRYLSRNWKNILMIVLAVALVLAAVGGLAAIFTRDTDTIGPGEFKRGKLDALGNYEESKQAIYTKKAFSCQGLRIVPDFEAGGKFDVYYYDENDSFLGATTGQNSVFEEDYPAASHCRIVYYPEKPSGVKTSEWKIGLLEVRKYAKLLKITVDRDQESYTSSPNLYVAESTTGSFTKANITTLDTNAAVKSSTLVELNGEYDLYRVYVKATTVSDFDAVVAFGDEAGKAIYLNEDGKVEEGYAHTFDSAKMLVGSWYAVVVEAPEEADTLRVMAPTDAEVRIYGVK